MGKPEGNGRASGACMCCGGKDCCEFDWGMDNKVTMVCSDCGIIASIPAQVIRRPDRDVLKKGGLYNAVLGLCGTQDDVKEYRG